MVKKILTRDMFIAASCVTYPLLFTGLEIGKTSVAGEAAVTTIATGAAVYTLG